MSTATLESLIDAVSAARAVKDDAALQVLAEQLDATDGDDAKAWADYARGVAALVRGDLPMARVHAKKAYETFESSDHVRGRVQALNVLGRVIDGMGDPLASLTTYQQALALAESINDRSAIAGTLNNIGNAQNNAGEYAEALRTLERAVELHEACGDTADVANTTTNIGLVLIQLGDWSAALERYHRALAIQEQLGGRNAIARTVNNIGNAYHTIGNYAEALEHFNRAKSIFEAIGDRDTTAILEMNIGNVYYSTGNYPAALTHYHRARALQTDFGNRRHQARAIDCIGNVLFVGGNITAALEHYEQALAMYEAIGNRSGVASELCNIGGVHAERKEYDEAIHFLGQALAIRNELRERHGIATVRAAMIGVHIGAERYDEAASLLTTLDQDQIDDPNSAIERELYRAILQQHTGAVDDARATLLRAMDTAVERSILPKQADIHKLLRDLAQVSNNFADYITHNNEYTRITEEIIGRDTATKLALQEKQREIDTREREHQQQLAVLHSTLPKEVAERVARGEVVNDHFENATVIFLDIVGFTEISSTLSSQEVITLLDDVFTQCDEICAKHGVTKIKTIGDSYMAVGFNVEGRASVVDSARCALEMSQIEYRIENRESKRNRLEFRIGIHCGPVTAGIIGKERMQYDVWGDTVNVASRMESTGLPGRCHISETVAKSIENREYRIEERGFVEIKGKGMMRTFWLDGKR